MDIELYSLLATLVLVATLASVVFAIASYGMFRVREHRKLARKNAAHSPAASVTPPGAKGDPGAAVHPQFFKPYDPA